MDTEACTLELDCESDTTEPRIRVQRQSVQGPGRVPALIRALYGMP